ERPGRARRRPLLDSTQFDGVFMEPLGNDRVKRLFHQRHLHDPHRRNFLALAGTAALSWLTPIGQLLAQKAEESREPAQSIILLWLAGGPSQLETFDPHPDTMNAGGTRAIRTAVKGIQLAQGFDRLADEMGAVSLVRSLVSKEGDHERATYY